MQCSVVVLTFPDPGNHVSTLRPGSSGYLPAGAGAGPRSVRQLLAVSAAMSHRTLPVLFINLGGEMIYIIDARLKAQAVEKERSNKVLGWVRCSVL